MLIKTDKTERSTSHLSRWNLIKTARFFAWRFQNSMQT